MYYLTITPVLIQEFDIPKFESEALWLDEAPVNEIMHVPFVSNNVPTITINSLIVVYCFTHLLL